MEKLNKYQKITILSTGILILVAILFPPWIGQMSTNPKSTQSKIELDFKDPFDSKAHEPKGIPDFVNPFEKPKLNYPNPFEEPKANYHTPVEKPKVIYRDYRFIFNPPEEIEASIDFKRLGLQIIALLLAGGLAFLAVGWLQTSVKETSSDKPVPTSFKTKEQYEQWKNERLQLKVSSSGKKPSSSTANLPTVLSIGALIINLGYVITRSRNLAEFIGFSVGYCGGAAAICYIIAKITARNNPGAFRLHFGWSFVIVSLIVIFGNIYRIMRMN